MERSERLRTVRSRVYVVGTLGLYAIFPLAFLAVVLDWRTGGELIVVVLVVHFLGQQFRGLIELERVVKPVIAAEAVPLLLMTFGTGIALVEAELGASLVVTGIVSRLLLHVAQGASAYRAVMARPWPEVQPLTDDDW